MRKDHENVLVIDIGSGSVGLGLVSNYKTGSKNDSKKNIINFCTRYELEYTNEVNFGTSPEKMLSGIENSLKQIPKQTIDKIHIFLHSPWHVVHTKQVLISDPKKINLTKKLVQKTSESEIANFTTYAKTNLHGYDQLTLIESTVPEVKINGYIVPDPFNKKVDGCEFLLSLAFAPSNVVASIENLCLKFFALNKKNIKFRSATLAFAHVCGTLYSGSNGIMILDVGSEITDISLIKNNVLNFGVSFAEGTHDIVRKISQTLNTNFSDASSKAHARFLGILNTSLSTQIDDCLKPLEDGWQKSVANSLAKAPKNEIIPKTVVLICEESAISPWYNKSIATDTFTQYLKTDGKFRIISPNTDALKNNLDVHTDVKYVDISLSLLCISL